MPPNRFPLLLLFGLLLAVLLGACAPHVSPASAATLRKLNNRAIPPPHLPTSGRARFNAYPHRAPHVQTLRLPLISNLNVPAIPARINGVPLHLILDTGAADVPLLLEAKSAAKAGLHPLKGVLLKGSGVGGSVRVAVGRFESLHLANHLLLGPGHAGILLQSYSQTLAGIPVRSIPLNILGMRTLQTFSYVTIDTPKKEVEIGFHTPYRPHPGEISFDFEIHNDCPRVALQIGGKTVRALFDTGCSSAVSLNQNDLCKIPAQSYAKGLRHTQKSMGIAGLETALRGTFEEVTVGPIHLKGVEFDATTADSDSLLGWGALRTRRIVLDFTHRKVWIAGLAPRPNKTR
jgi:hypothetical protein